VGERRRRVPLAVRIAGVAGAARVVGQDQRGGQAGHVAGAGRGGQVLQLAAGGPQARVAATVAVVAVDDAGGRGSLHLAALDELAGLEARAALLRRRAPRRARRAARAPGARAPALTEPFVRRGGGRAPG